MFTPQRKKYEDTEETKHPKHQPIRDTIHNLFTEKDVKDDSGILKSRAEAKVFKKAPRWNGSIQLLIRKCVEEVIAKADP